MSYELILPFFPRELRTLLLDDTISDLMVNGTNGVYAERNGIVEHVPLAEAFDNERLHGAIVRIARILGQDLTDYKTAQRLAARPGFEYKEYESLMRLGRQLEVFEQLLRERNAPINPLVVITPIVDKHPRILAVTGMGALNLDDFTDTPLEEPGMMPDYLKAYITDAGFDLPRLINDDYFLAIKLLFNARHYVSAAKFLVSAIDTIAVVDAGDVRDSFILWLNTYANLASLGITAKELWEFRNGVLHMTTLNSRDVAKGNTVPLIFYVDNVEGFAPSTRTGAKYISLKGLIETFAAAISRWINTYNANPDKFVDFVTRYDLTISDSRMARFSSKQHHAPTATHG